MEDNYGIYKYTGPVMLVGDHNQFEFVEGSLVKAEVNINIATIRSFYHQFKEDYEEIPPVYVAAKYLEPVKPETIDFTKDDNSFDVLEKKINEFFNQEGFIKELLDNKDKFPFISGMYPLTADGKKIDVGKFINKKELEKFFDKYNHSKGDTTDDHEVGGNHYKMAIEPWDYIQANGLDFDEGNIVKYASRHKQKNGAEDIKKIISYAKHILKTQYNEEV